MFTGIIESQGIIKRVTGSGHNKTFWIKSPISTKLKIDQSISHDGVCLTVEEVKNNRHRVTAVEETLKKTTLDNWQEGWPVNLERCLKLNSRLDGHFVQGHVDALGKCFEIKEKVGSIGLSIQFPENFSSLVVEKGSITINGISLTAYNVGHNSFDVSIIPYTAAHTNINNLVTGSLVNLEFDLIGKYINRKLSLGEQ